MEVCTADNRCRRPAVGSVAPWLRPHTVCGPFCGHCGQLVDDSARLLCKLARLLHTGADISDVELDVGTRAFRVHRLVLACSSDVLRVMLLERSRWAESVVTRLRLHEDPACVAVFDHFIAYFYTGVVQLDHDNVLALLILADKYNVRDLQEVCVEYMQSHLVATADRMRVISWLHYANLSAHRPLAESCHQFVVSNFHKVSLCAQFVDVEHHDLVELLKSSDLVVPDEMEVCRAARRWLISQKESLQTNGAVMHRGDDERCHGDHHDDMTKLAVSIFSCIRFSLLTARHLSEMSSLCASAGLLAGLQMAQAHDHLQSEPRNYTCDVWSASLTVDNFAALPAYTACPLFFSSPSGGASDVIVADTSDADAENTYLWEWTAELFPKGVRFERSVVIGLWRNLEVAGACYEHVRLTIEAKDCRDQQQRRVTVAVLLTGVQDGLEYVRRVVDRRCTFDATERAHSFIIVPYDELNRSGSLYMSGTEKDCFRITIIIKPAPT